MLDVRKMASLLTSDHDMVDVVCIGDDRNSSALIDRDGLTQKHLAVTPGVGYPIADDGAGRQAIIRGKGPAGEPLIRAQGDVAQGWIGSARTRQAIVPIAP